MKSILVTGSSSGIGAAICEHFSQIGWKVFGSVRNQNDGDRLTNICGENFVCEESDATGIRWQRARAIVGPSGDTFFVWILFFFLLTIIIL